MFQSSTLGDAKIFPTDMSEVTMQNLNALLFCTSAGKVEMTAETKPAKAFIEELLSVRLVGEGSDTWKMEDPEVLCSFANDLRDHSGWQVAHLPIEPVFRERKPRSHGMCHANSRHAHRRRAPTIHSFRREVTESKRH